MRRGDDVTIVAALATVRTALESAGELAAEGIEADVIDLRSLRPIDAETLVESAARTGALVVVEEGPPAGGYAAEVISLVAERADGVAAKRVTMPDLPIPFSGVLEDAVLPRTADVTAAARTVLSARARGCACLVAAWRESAPSSPARARGSVRGIAWATGEAGAQRRLVGATLDVWRRAPRPAVAHTISP